MMESLSPALLGVLEQKGKAYGIEQNSFEGYATFLRYFEQAAARLAQIGDPVVLDIDDADRLLVTEMEALADLVIKIFPRGGFEEFSSYLQVVRDAPD